MESLVFGVGLFAFNMILAKRCGADLFFTAVVSFFVPIVATPMLLYWNVS